MSLSTVNSQSPSSKMLMQHCSVRARPNWNPCYLNELQFESRHYFIANILKYIYHLNALWNLLAIKMRLMQTNITNISSQAEPQKQRWFIWTRLLFIPILFIRSDLYYWDMPLPRKQQFFAHEFGVSSSLVSIWKRETQDTAQKIFVPPGLAGWR